MLAVVSGCLVDRCGGGGGGGGVVVVGVVNKQEIISVPETAILAASCQKAADMRAGNRPYRTVYSGVSVV